MNENEQTKEQHDTSSAAGDPSVDTAEGEELDFGAVGANSTADPPGTYVVWCVRERPKTPEDALAIAQVIYDLGLVLAAQEGSELAEAFDANPILFRAYHGLENA